MKQEREKKEPLENENPWKSRKRKIGNPKPIIYRTDGGPQEGVIWGGHDQKKRPYVIEKADKELEEKSEEENNVA